MKGHILRMLNICLHETNLSLNHISVQFYLFIYLFIHLFIYLFICLFYNISTIRQYPKGKKKKKIKTQVQYVQYNSPIKEPAEDWCVFSSGTFS